jgi:hypothetical protein
MDSANPVFLDYNATTPLLPEVVDAMLPYLREQSGHLWDIIWESAAGILLIASRSVLESVQLSTRLGLLKLSFANHSWPPRASKVERPEQCCCQEGGLPAWRGESGDD